MAAQLKYSELRRNEPQGSWTINWTKIEMFKHIEQGHVCRNKK